MTNYLRDALLNAVYRGITYTSPTNVFLALWIGDPTATGIGGAEVSTAGTAYVRQQITFGAPAGNIIANSAQIDFPDATAAYGTVDYAQIMDLAALGNPLINGLLTNAKTIDADDQFRVKIGDLTVQHT
jgi:hypothetical protein